MAEIKRMRKILMLITSVKVKIQLPLKGTFIGQFLKGSNMGPIKKFKYRKVKKLFRDRIVSIIISYALF